MNAAEDFGLVVTSHVVAAAMSLLQITKKGDNPCHTVRYYPEGFDLHADSRYQLLMTLSIDLVSNYFEGAFDVDARFEEEQSTDDVCNYAKKNIKFGASIP